MDGPLPIACVRLTDDEIAMLDAALAACGEDMANALDKGFVIGDEPPTIELKSTREVAGKPRRVTLVFKMQNA